MPDSVGYNVFHISTIYFWSALRNGGDTVAVDDKIVRPNALN
jgi:hypothetical protein